MARIALVTPAEAAPETRAVYAEIAADWGGTLLTDVQALGGSPTILLALHRLSFLLRSEHGGSLASVQDKELAGLRTAALNGGHYCLAHSVELGRAAGLTIAQVHDAVGEDYDDSRVLDERQRALLRWATSLSDGTAGQDDDALAELSAFYTDAEIAELTLVCCLANGWSRFTEALGIELEPVEERDLTACLAPRP